MAWSRVRSRWKLGVGIAVVGVVLAVAVIVYGLGLIAVERHRGYFSPVWDPDGRQIYFIQRDTFGIVWGPGWEFFTPPAYSYVVSDRLSLRRLDPARGRPELLEGFAGSPLEGRITRHYRGRIFNFMSARLEPVGQGIDFLLDMKVPRIPTSESWSLKGSWAPDTPSAARWTEAWAGSTASPDAVLMNGVELMTVKGRESFPAAILAVQPDGSYRVLQQNDDFSDLYPKGVPPRLIAERSRRESIERSREIGRVRADLIAGYREQGLNEGEAWLRAHDDMEELGYLPKSPRLVATLLQDLPPDVRVFEIPEEHFRVGLFQDIAEAMSRSGEEVKTGTGTYLKYYDDETGPRLKAWREAGNDRFGVRTGGRLYLLEVRRFRP